MMKMKPLFLIIPFMAFLVGCAMVSTTDINFKTTVDPKVNFNGYKTYTWAGSAIIVNDPYGQWEPQGFDADKEVRFLINRELREQGMSESSVNPDVYIAYAAGVDMTTLGFKENPESEVKHLVNVPQGGLVIVFLDARTKYIAWAGAAGGEVQEERTAETIKARLDYVVTHLLKKLPKD